MPFDGAWRQGHFKMVCILSGLGGRINPYVSATLVVKFD